MNDPMHDDDPISGVEMGDGTPGDAYCEGDQAPEDIDWDQVAKLKILADTAHELPERAKELMHFEMLADMYGDDLELI